MRIRCTPAAAADLKAIYDYLKEHEPHFARPTVIELRKIRSSLKKFPLRDARDAARHPRTTAQALAAYIAYRVNQDAVEILVFGIPRRTGKNRLAGPDQILKTIARLSGPLKSMAR